MSCPDWAALVRDREPAGAVEMAEWSEAVAHLRGCAACRRRALALDPTLVFLGCRDLTIDRAEVAELTRATYALRRVRSLEAAPVPGAARRRAMAAGLGLAGVLLLPAVPTDPALEPPAPPEASASANPIARPWIENLDRPAARVYQWGSPELAVVVVIDESLDV